MLDATGSADAPRAEADDRLGAGGRRRTSPGLVYARLIGDPSPAGLRSSDGALRPLPVDRWSGRHTAVDEVIAASAVGPVLDVGCGPGRLLDALAHRGTDALGVDISAAAVAAARERGRQAELGDVFAHVPHAGWWATALLLDGNVGIGGDPVSLLERVASVLRPEGVMVVELDAPGSPSVTGDVRIETEDVVSDWFRWAHVGVDGITAVADAAGRTVRELAPVGDRWFAWIA